ncbi:MAG: hypothetical protein ACFFA6_08050 [Promethearchaeota archaeon]
MVVKISDELTEENFEEVEEVKQYLKRIYSVLPKKIQIKLETLNVSYKKKKFIVKELAFLSEKKQIRYLEELYRIYN